MTPPLPQRRFWRPHAELLAVCAAILCYANVLPNDFCDDAHPVIVLNDRVTEPGRWLDCWTTDYWYDLGGLHDDRDLLYRPLALTSYRLIHALVGPLAWVHSLVNVALHALVTLLTVRLCRRLGGREATALVCGVLFAVLPIHTEVIDNVVGRADLLATGGVLAGGLAHLRSLHATGDARRWLWRGGAALAVFAAMTSKESGVSAIAVVVLLDAFAAVERASPARRDWFRPATLARLAYLAVVVAAYFALRYHALEGRLHQAPAVSKTVNVLVDAPPWQHVLGVVQIWGMYWWKTIWPSVLSVNYSVNAIRLATSPLDRAVLVGVLVTALLIFGSLHLWRRGRRGFAFAAAVIVAGHLPTANAFVLIQVFFAERNWYLPSVGVAIVAAMAAAPLLSQDTRETGVRGGAGAFRRNLRIALAVALAFAMVLRCWIRNTEWRHNGTVYASAYRDLPDAIGARLLYGEWLVYAGRYDEGIALLRSALEIDLGYTDAHRIIGRAYLAAGDWDNAFEHLRIADVQIPHHAPTVTALEQAREQLREREGDALEHLRRAADADPANAEAETAYLRKLRDLAPTHDVLQRIHAREPALGGELGWQHECAVTLVFLDRRNEAIERYRRCLSLAPRDAQLAVEAAGLLMERGREDDLAEAEALAARAASIAPNQPGVLSCRAELLALRGDLAGAVDLYRRAVGLLPPGSPQREVYEQRMRVLGG
jgi:tetratricopeptide (TPR) repeat protein